MMMRYLRNLQCIRKITLRKYAIELIKMLPYGMNGKILLLRLRTSEK